MNYVLVEQVGNHLTEIVSLIDGKISDERLNVVLELMATITTVVSEDTSVNKPETVINFDVEKAGDGVHDLGNGHEVVVSNGTMHIRPII